MNPFAFITSPMTTAISYLTSSDESAGQVNAALLSDGKGNFLVRQNGRIEVKSGYPNVGKIYAPSDAAYPSIIRALGGHSQDNARKIQQVIGVEAFARAMAKPPVPSSSGRPATMDDVAKGDLSIPLYRQPWFLPVSAAGGAIVVAIFLLRRRQRKG